MVQITSSHRRRPTKSKQRRLLMESGVFASVFLVVSLSLLIGVSFTSSASTTTSSASREQQGEEDPEGFLPRSLLPSQLSATSTSTSPRAEIPNFTRNLPAEMCVSFNAENLQCQVQPCNDTMFLSPDYSHGFVHRPASLRNHSMMLSGQAKAGSGCAISHRYQFLYIHVLKSGGMTIKTFLKQALCHLSTKMPCKGGPDALQIVSCRTAIQRYPHYFVWSFVRNPYGRMYSSYAMALDYNHKKGRNETLPPFEFEQYVTAKGGGGNLHPHSKKRRYNRGIRPTTTNGRQLRELFMPHNRQSLHLPPRRGSKTGNHPLLTLTPQCQARRSLTYMDPVHCQPQYQFLFDDDHRHCPVFDFLGRLEHFQQDLKRVVGILQSPELDRHYQIWWNQSTASSNTTEDNNGLLYDRKDNSTSFGSQQKQAKLGGNLQRAYQRNNNNGLRQAVAKEYALDFELLGYDPNVVPV
jgi:hypothetical protein